MKKIHVRDNVYKICNFKFFLEAEGERVEWLLVIVNLIKISVSGNHSIFKRQVTLFILLLMGKARKSSLMGLQSRKIKLIFRGRGIL